MPQDFTTYTEFDPNNRFTVTSTKIDVVGLPATEDAYVYKDFGVNYFNGNFQHTLEVYINSASQDGGDLVVCGLTNVVDDEFGIRTSLGDELGTLLTRQAGVPAIYVFEDFGGTFFFQQVQVSFNTLYYLTFSRDESVGLNGTIYTRIYSDANRTNLLNTISVALHAKKDFRYCHAAQSVNYGNAATFTGYTQNLSHGAVVQIPPVFFSESILL